MTINPFIFCWCSSGIESIISIKKYEDFEKQNLVNAIKNNKLEKNPLNDIICHLRLRAQFNPQRFYEIYAVDCSIDLDEKFWENQWKEYPQYTADLIREKGIKIFSERKLTKDVIT